MLLLHTSDWHLGQKFLFNERREENRRALQWLLRTIREEEVDLLIVAGDIFDIGNPPNYARQLYYQFLVELRSTPCRHIVIVGGNHDSPNMLNAPRELLRTLDIQVLGSAPAEPEEQILELRDPAGALEGVVAAVPFLRDRDIRQALPGESSLERIERIQEGIKQHYARLSELMQPYAEENVPLIATGHLYAKGARAAAEQANIYLGDRENMAAADFPELFDYIALGHLHRSQHVGRAAHIRYSGSLIPLSFSETEDEKSITLAHFPKGKRMPELRFLPAPCFRRLRTLTGSPEEVQLQLTALAEDKEGDLEDWIDALLQLDRVTPNLQAELQAFAKDLPLQLLKIRIEQEQQSLEDSLEEHRQLDELTPIEVFRKKCESLGKPPEEMEELERTFLELQDWMRERQGE